MDDVLSSLPALQAALDTLAVRHRVPGAMLSIYDGERNVDLVTGVTSRETGVEVTPDTIFQIGSITKVYTASLMMRLVDQGKLDLDTPVRSYVPSFQLNDEAATELITPRHLLTHSSGIVGDYFADHGTGDDCLERYVASLKEHAQVHGPGLMLSYCNAGFSVAGRVVEVVCGKPYDDVLREELLEPLGLRSTTVLPEEMLRFRCAVGHGLREGSGLVVPKVVLMDRSSIPAGSRTTATAADVVSFARMHIDKGRAVNGSVVVSEEGVKAMRVPTLPLFGPENCRVGLGWMVSDWAGEQCLWHTGGTIGQLAFLYVLPDRPFAVCLLTNSDTGGHLWKELGTWIFKTLAGVDIPTVPRPPTVPPSIELQRYAASYERLSHRFDVEARDDHLQVTITSSGLDGAESSEVLALRPIDERRFHARVDGMEVVMTFLEPDDEGRPRYLHFGSRAAARAN